MKLIPFCITALWCLFQVVTASALPGHDLLLKRNTLQARNLSAFIDDPPSECKLQCEVPVGAALGCSFLGCVCTEDNSRQFETCINCVVALNPTSSEIAKGQGLLDEWSDDYCQDFQIPELHLNVTNSPTSSSTALNPTNTARAPNTTSSATTLDASHVLPLLCFTALAIMSSFL